ncbi:hypothetical protein E3N88_16088 [Mikania micrantha]|uniref:Uncharacterized protein n=1 Tax=Mikania micrantha TaxID=192012 RepID=A0A5N6NYQ3_9ASTR|nr:hypothetical protein E3N88_16088 [Mikania micrantha]
MHRQSLGSPASQIQCHGVLFSGAGVIKDDTGNDFISDDHRKDKLAPCPASSVDDVERKSQKTNQQKSIPVSSSTRLIHLIPILMFFCFLILYLSSHDPSKHDLAQNSGFTTLPSKQTAIDREERAGDSKHEELAKRSPASSPPEIPTLEVNRFFFGGFSGISFISMLECAYVTALQQVFPIC